MLGSSGGGKVSNLRSEEKRIEAGFEVPKKAQGCSRVSGLHEGRGFWVGFSIKRGKSFLPVGVSL